MMVGWLWVRPGWREIGWGEWLGHREDQAPSSRRKAVGEHLSRYYYGGFWPIASCNNSQPCSPRNATVHTQKMAKTIFRQTI